MQPETKVTPLIVLILNPHIIYTSYPESPLFQMMMLALLNIFWLWCHSTVCPNKLSVHHLCIVSFICKP